MSLVGPIPRMIPAGHSMTLWFANCLWRRKCFITMIQYIPRNMPTVFALLCFVVVIHWLIFPYPSGLIYWHCGNLTIAPVPAKQSWWIWINTSCEFIMNDCITTTKQSTTKPFAYFLGYTACDAKSIILEPGRARPSTIISWVSLSHWISLFLRSWLSSVVAVILIDCGSDACRLCVLHYNSISESINFPKENAEMYGV